MAPVAKGNTAPSPSGRIRSATRPLFSAIQGIIFYVILPCLVLILSLRITQTLVWLSMTVRQIAGWNLRLSLYSLADLSILGKPVVLLALRLRHVLFDMVLLGFISVWDEIVIMGVFMLLQSMSIQGLAIIVLKDVLGITAAEDAHARQALRFSNYRRLTQRIQNTEWILAQAYDDGDILSSNLRCASAFCKQGEASARALDKELCLQEAALSDSQTHLRELSLAARAAARAHAEAETRSRQRIVERRAALDRLQGDRVALERAKTAVVVRQEALRAMRQAEVEGRSQAFKTKLDTQFKEHARITERQKEKMVALRAELESAKAAVAQTEEDIQQTELTSRKVLVGVEGRLADVRARVETKRRRIKEREEHNAANAALSEARSTLCATSTRARRAARAHLASLASAACRAHLAGINTLAQLEEKKEWLADALRSVEEDTTALGGSLESTTAQHAAHMGECTRARAAAAGVTALRAEMAAAEARLRAASASFAGAEAERREVGRERARVWGVSALVRKRRRCALDGYRCAEEVGAGFAARLGLTLEEQKQQINEREKSCIPEIREMAVDTAALKEKTSTAQDALADTYETLSTTEIRVARLRAKLATTTRAEAALAATRTALQQRFTHAWAHARRARRRLRASPRRAPNCDGDGRRWVGRCEPGWRVEARGGQLLPELGRRRGRGRGLVGALGSLADACPGEPVLLPAEHASVRGP